MKKFFEEYGSVAIIVIVIAVLLLIVGSVKGLDEVTGKVNGFGVASIVGNAYAKAIKRSGDYFFSFQSFKRFKLFKNKKIKTTCLFSCFQNF